jgi:predicted transcriptional regulator
MKPKTKGCSRCTHGKKNHPEGGPCTYGHGTPFGGCHCPGWNARRNRADTTETTDGFDLDEQIGKLKQLGGAFVVLLCKILLRSPKLGASLSTEISDPSGLLGVRPSPLTRMVTAPKSGDIEDIKTFVKEATRKTDANSKGPSRVLAALVQFGGTYGLTNEELRLYTGFTRSSVNTYVQALKSDALVERSGKSGIVATVVGVRRWETDGEKLFMNVYELRKWWIQKLAEGPARVLNQLLATSIGATSVQLQDATGYTRSTVNTYVQELRKYGLVARSGGVVVAHDRLLSEFK